MAGRPLTDEQKARMAEGRRLARERKALEPKEEVAAAALAVDEAGSLLTAADLEYIREQASKKVEAERADALRADKNKAIKKAIEDETAKLRKEAGLANHMDDLLQILIDVAPFSGDIKIDGTIYEHGRWYTVDRRKYETIREICARSWDAEDRAGNPNRKFYRNVAGTMNPMHNERRGSDGTLTMFPEGSVLNAINGGTVNAPGKGIAG